MNAMERITEELSRISLAEMVRFMLDDEDNKVQTAYRLALEAILAKEQ